MLTKCLRWVNQSSIEEVNIALNLIYKWISIDKPSVTVEQISSSNFQIKLSNINNIMTSKEFETWILSLNYHSFDIQLFPPKIISPSNKCILSFDTINAAIHVKQTLENVQFRQFPLYFTYWHVHVAIKNQKIQRHLLVHQN